MSRRIDRLNSVNDKLKQIRSIQSGLLQLSELASQVHDLSEFFPQLHRVVADFLQQDNFYVALENPNGELELTYFVDQVDDSQLPKRLHLTGGITDYVYQQGQTLLCTKVMYHTLVNTGAIEAKGEPPELWLGVPLVSEGRTIGVMVSQSYDPQAHIDEQALALFEHLGQHLLTAISRVKQRQLLELAVVERTTELQSANKVLAKEVKQREHGEKLQKLLFAIAEMSSTSAHMSEFYANLRKTLSKFMNMDNCYVALVEGNTLTFPFYQDQYNQNPCSRELTKGLTEYVLATGETELINEQRAKSLVDSGEIIRCNSHLATSWLGAPLRVDDKVLGVISVQAYDNEHEYCDRDLLLLNFVSFQIALAIQRQLAKEQLNKSYLLLESKVAERTKELIQTNAYLRTQIEERHKAEQQLYHQANHDVLTDLPNRAMFTAKLEQVLKHAQRHNEHHFALLFIDLDKFKHINDTLGHKAGDEFLVEVSQRIKSCVRGNDLVARIGGDEFVIILDSLPDQEYAEEIASRLNYSIGLPMEIDHQHVQSGASIGIAFCDPSIHQNADAIVKDADIAMYAAKSLGRGQYVVCNDTLKSEVESKEQLSEQLHQALVSNDVLLNRYQPIFSKFTDTVSCYIADSRIEHAEFGDVSKADYANLLADAKLDLEFDYKYIELADNQLTGQVVFLPITVNHLNHIKTVDALQQQLSSCSQTQIVLTFVEAQLLKLNDQAFKHLRMLKKAGVQLAISQFGDGGGALGLLTRVHFDYVLFSGGLIKSMAANPAQHALLDNSISFALSQKVRPILTGLDLQQHMERSEVLNVDLVAGQYITDMVKTNTNQQDNNLLFQHGA